MKGVHFAGTYYDKLIHTISTHPTVKGISIAETDSGYATSGLKYDHVPSGPTVRGTLQSMQKYAADAADFVHVVRGTRYSFSCHMLTYYHSLGQPSESRDIFTSLNAPRFRVRLHEVKYAYPLTPDGGIISVNQIILLGLNLLKGGRVPKSEAEAEGWLLFDKTNLNIVDQDTLERLPVGSEIVLVPKRVALPLAESDDE